MTTSPALDGLTRRTWSLLLIVLLLLARTARAADAAAGNDVASLFMGDEADVAASAAAAEDASPAAQLWRACSQRREEDALRLLDAAAADAGAVAVAGAAAGAAASAGLDADRAGERGWSPLMWAAFYGLETLAARLVAAGARLERTDEVDGASAAMLAARGGHARILTLLADAGARLAHADKAGDTALVFACYLGSVETAELLAVRSPAAARGPVSSSGKSALDWCELPGGRRDVARLALASATIRARRAGAGRAAGGEAAGAREAAAIDAAGSVDTAARAAALPAAEARAKGEALAAACRGARAEEALRLVSEGADVNFVGGGAGEGGGSGLPPLILAIRSGLEGVAARLIAAGADLDFADADGWSALFWACSRAHAATAAALVEGGARLDRVAGGRTALMFALDNAMGPTAQLLASGMGAAALNAVDADGASAYDIARAGGHRKDVRALAAAAATIRARGGRSGATLKAKAASAVAAEEAPGEAGAAVAAAEAAVAEARAAEAAAVAAAAAPLRRRSVPAAESRALGAQLAEACMLRRGEEALRLVRAGADVDFAGSHDGMTPLMWASGAGLLDVAALLVAAGAQLDLAASASGWTAAHWAGASNQSAAARLLAERGAALELVDAAGRTALALACAAGHPGPALALAARMGAPALNLVDRAGRTALDYAAQVAPNAKDRAAVRRALELEPAAEGLRAAGGKTAEEVLKERRDFHQ